VDWQDFIVGMAETAAPQMQTLANYKAYMNERAYEEDQAQKERDARMMEHVFTDLYLPNMRDEDKVKFNKKYQAYFEEEAKKAAINKFKYETATDRAKIRATGRQKEKYEQGERERINRGDLTEFERAELDKNRAYTEKIEEETRQLKDFTKRQKAELDADEKRMNRTDKLPLRAKMELDSLFKERKNAKSQVGWNYKPGTIEYQNAVDSIQKFYDDKMDAIEKKYAKGERATELPSAIVEVDRKALREAISKGVVNEQVIALAKGIKNSIKTQDEANAFAREMSAVNSQAWDEIVKHLQGE